MESCCNAYELYILFILTTDLVSLIQLQPRKDHQKALIVKEGLDPTEDPLTAFNRLMEAKDRKKEERARAGGGHYRHDGRPPPPSGYRGHDSGYRGGPPYSRPRAYQGPRGDPRGSPRRGSPPHHYRDHREHRERESRRRSKTPPGVAQTQGKSTETGKQRFDKRRPLSLVA